MMAAIVFARAVDPVISVAEPAIVTVTVSSDKK
jgi:hypothetical protein